jgi:ribosomal protein S18 acetylase RimI-like enzyme
MNVEVFIADYHNPKHAYDLGWLLNQYARDPMGGGGALPGEITDNLARELAKRPQAFSVLCYVDGEPAGLVNCVEGFSTFLCKPLVNIHDVAVVKAFRGLKLSHKMLSLVEVEARARGCCKLTLEVLQGNRVAQGSYQAFGFGGYELDPTLGAALFWQKLL